MPEDDPKWLTLFCAGASAAEIAQAWFEAMSPEEQQTAKKEPTLAARALRSIITGTDRPEVQKDRENGWKYTGAIMRAADAVLGVPPPKTRFNNQQNGNAAAGAAANAGAAGGYANGTAPAASATAGGGQKKAEKAPLIVLEGGKCPGKLAITWSTYEGARNLEKLRELGVTHRLNVALEVVGHLPEDEPEDGRAAIVTKHIPMEDAFHEDEGLRETWTQQLKEVLEQLLEWSKEGAVVNINCQMGKNRSGAAVLMWLCTQCGWQYANAVLHLRKMNSLACGNPHLLLALGDALGVDGRMELNPAHDGGGWICISPPGTPRAGAPQESFEDMAAKAAARLGGVEGEKKEPAKCYLDDDSDDEKLGEMEGLFDGISDDEVGKGDLSEND
eukprot:TRINITY_DN21796_c0_g1_i1.p1 TRINITY_DN21796_c0_g1~~TRINITY_DN21796_c0_g1_i1.p1  ORF type:complete len:414 (+),score=104.64 TRINITY_DN21796_c0_g1_i1:80-1243(+)